MTDYTNWKVLKSVINYRGDDEEKQAASVIAQEEYEQVLDWCEENPYWVIEDGEYYHTASSEPTIEEKKISVSVLCSQYINDISWRVERYNTQKAINVETSDSEEMYLYILKYMEYCREYDDQDNNWWEQNPLDFDTWIETFSKK